MRTIAWAAALLLAAVLASGQTRALEQAPTQQQPPAQQAPAPAPEQAPAQEEVAFRASATAIYSDNPARTASGGESATALEGLIGLRLAHQSPMLFVDSDMSVVQRGYAQGGLPSETIPNGYLNLLAGPAAGVFNWTLTDTFGQISSQPFAALVAADRQNVNVLSTGPNLRIPFGSLYHLDLDGRYGLATFGDSALDQHSYSGKMALAHDVGPNSHAAIVYDYEHIEFHETRPASARIQEAYAEYSLGGARTYVVLQAGVDQLDEAGLPSHHTPHVLALLRRHLTERLTFEAAYRNAYVDTGEAFVASSRDLFTAGTDQNVQPLALPFQESQAYAKLTRTAGRLLAAVQLTASREAYPSEPALDRHTWGAQLSCDYQLSSSFTFNVRGGYWDDYEVNTGHAGHWAYGGAGVNRTFGRSLSLSLFGYRGKGTGTALTNPYTEDQVELQLTYSPGAARLRGVYDTNAQYRYYDRPVQPPLAH